MASVTALGMIETIGLVSAIEAADAGLKAAQVRLLGTDYVRGGLVMVRFEGEVAAVQAAVDAGAAAAQRVGKVFSAHVIPRAMPEVFCMLASDPSVGPGKRYRGGCVSCGGCEGGRRELAAMARRRAGGKSSFVGETQGPPFRGAEAVRWFAGGLFDVAGTDSRGDQGTAAPSPGASLWMDGGNLTAARPDCLD